MINLDSFTVGIALAGNLLLGFIVFFAKRKSATATLFLLLTVAISAWSLVNFFSYNANTPHTALLLVRLVLFFAVPIGTLFFFFSQTFPNDEFKIPGKYVAATIVYSIMAMVLTQTPYVFSGIKIIPESAPQPIIAPGIIVFIIIPVLAILFGIISLISRTIKAQGTEKKQYTTLSDGALTMFALIIIFDFIFPSFFNNTTFIPYSALFTLPFVAATAYTIFHDHLLNLKIIATESLIFVITLAICADIIFSTTLLQIISRFCILLLVLGSGINLIKSVRREVEQREQLEMLTSKLEDANGKLKALDIARSEFISIASHQLRTPPATIKWYLSALLDGDYGKFKKNQLDILTKANRTNNSLISLIDDMLNVSRIERGKMEFLFGPVNMPDLLNITYEQLYPIAHDKHLDLTTTITPKSKFPPIVADKEKIRQVMNNLIDNAIKYTKEGYVNAKLEAKKGEIRFTVTDNGKGISPEEMGTIFEKFSRGKESIKQSAGLGLGLYVAKIIIQEHKGKIWAESDGPGLGSRFIFTLPINNGLSKTTLVDLTKSQ